MTGNFGLFSYSHDWKFWIISVLSCLEILDYFLLSWLGILDWPKFFVCPLCSLYYKVPVIFPLPGIFVVLDVQCGCSQSETQLLPQEHVGQGFVIEDIVASNLQLQQWTYVGKTLAQNANRCFLHAKAAHSLQLLNAHVSLDDLTALRAVCLACWRPCVNL